MWTRVWTRVWARKWSLCALLLGAGGAGACGDAVPESRPPSKSGALIDPDQGEPALAPDVIVAWMPSLSATRFSELCTRAAGEDAASPQGGHWSQRGVRFEAAYARFADPAQNRVDFETMGAGAARILGTGNGERSGGDSPEFDAPWAAPLREAGYRLGSGEIGRALEFFEAESASPGLWMGRLPTADSPDSTSASIDRALQGLDSYFEAQTSRPRVLAVLAFAGDVRADPLTEARQRIPLWIGATVGIDPGEVRPIVVTLADVAPTLIDLCGHWPEGRATSDLQGASFARVLIKEPLAWRGFALALGPQGGAWVRSARWRLIQDREGNQRLSHVEEDPNRMQDDRSRPGATNQLRGLGLRLERWYESR